MEDDDWELGANYNKKIQKTAAVYVRVSTKRQLKEGYGLKAQEEECKRKIAYNRWKFYKTYKDEAISGTKTRTEREGLDDLLNDGKKGLFDCIVIYKLDRLGRSSDDLIKTIKYIINVLKLQLLSCSEDIDTSKPSGRLVLTMFAGIAEYEKDVIIERLEMGREHVLNQRGETGGRVPYGMIRYQDKEKTIGIDEEKAQVVVRIFEQYENGDSLEKISRDLNNDNIPSPRNKKWRGSSIRKIISKQDKYEGCIRQCTNEKLVRWPRVLRYNILPSVYIDNYKVFHETNKPNAAVYSRILNNSLTDYQERQIKSCIELIDKIGARLTAVYKEVNNSKIDNRDILKFMRDDIVEKDIQVLVVYNVYALGYTDDIITNVLNIINKNNNVSIYSVTHF